MSQHEDFIEGGNHLVCKLNKALYGLKQAARAWFSKLHSAFTPLGFTLARCHSSLFIQITNSHTMYMLVYVDDVIIPGNSQQAISNLIVALNATFSLKDLCPLHYFVGTKAPKSLVYSCLSTNISQIY